MAVAFRLIKRGKRGRFVKITERDRGWARLKRQVAKLDLEGVEVGIDPAKKNQDRGGITMGELAAVHEFGSPAAGIESRSFLRDTFDQNVRKYARQQARIATATIKGRNPRPLLFKLGETVRADVVERISGSIPPPLKMPRRRKGSDKRDIPLLDTGQLAGSIKAKVTRKGIL